MYQPDTHMGVNPYTGAQVLDAMGNKLADSPLPELRDIQAVAADAIYAPPYNTIYAVSGGARMWSSADPVCGQGAVTGNHVVFASGARVLALTH
jgi:hypothetical protein